MLLPRLIAGVLCSTAFIVSGKAADNPAAVPDFAGLWAREFIGFDAPASGPGPILNKERIPSGQSNPDRIVGDYTNAILKPQAAEVVKRRGEIFLGGRVAPDPYNQCGPIQPPLIFYQQQFRLVQQKNEIVFLYMYDHHVRHVRLNAQHPARLTPSWSGDSVGRYEGDTLVIDTVGVKVGPLSMVDMFGTPHSEALHVVERYRLIDYETAIAADKVSEKEHIHILPEFAVGDGIAVDPDYRGKALQLEFTVEDPNVFTTRWSAASTFRRAANDWAERVCAENLRDFQDRRPPRDDTPDF